MRCERIVAWLAAAGLIVAAIPAPGGARTILWVPICHGGYAPLSLPAKDAPAKPYPGACHAFCLGQRKRMGGNAAEA